MSNANPFAAPGTDVGDQDQAVDCGDVRALGTLKLTQLKNLSRYINLFMGIYILSFGTGVLMLAHQFYKPFLLVSLLGLILVVVTMVRRPTWGRYLMMGLCLTSMINPPLGTIIGGIGIFVFYLAGQLFGSDRYKHIDLHREYRKRIHNRKNLAEYVKPEEF